MFLPSLHYAAIRYNCTEGATNMLNTKRPPPPPFGRRPQPSPYDVRRELGKMRFKLAECERVLESDLVTQREQDLARATAAVVRSRISSLDSQLAGQEAADTAGEWLHGRGFKFRGVRS
jgi:hypothetical protein